MGIHLTHGILPKKKAISIMYNTDVAMGLKKKNDLRTGLLDDGEAIPRSTKKLLECILHNHLGHLLQDSVFLH